MLAVLLRCCLETNVGLLLPSTIFNGPGRNHGTCHLRLARRGPGFALSTCASIWESLEVQLPETPAELVMGIESRRFLALASPQLV